MPVKKEVKGKVAPTAAPLEDVQSDARLRSILLETHYVSEEEIKEAETIVKRRKMPLVDVLLESGAITKDLLGQAIAESFHAPYADLNSRVPSPEQVALLSEDVARKYQAVVFARNDKAVVVATADPANKELLVQLAQVFPKQKVSLAYALPEDVAATFVFYRKPLETRFAKILQDGVRLAPELVAQIFEDALALRASDVHFEPQEKNVIIRFRVDGILREAGQLPKENYESVLNRIKVQSQLRIDQHAAAQDGAIRSTVGDKSVDMRVSIVPVLNGEKIVIRILAQYVRGFALKDLGFSSEDQVKIESSSKKPFGMILIVGPTGSGKTTTLYGLLKKLHRAEVNVTTIEDPVEYRIPGINQIQVNNETDLTFAKGLRAIVRQDPNIILVGEIRDTETAEIAVNAALTGHLLLSTFHANDAATAIPRLLDIGVEPFLLASTLELVVAQRLVRRLCENCRFSVTLSAEDIAAVSSTASAYFAPGSYYKGKGCAACNQSGYAGRMAIFECININRALQDLILKSPTSAEIWAVAREQGSVTLFEDGVAKVMNGITTLEELFRVAVPPKEMQGAKLKTAANKAKAQGTKPTTAQVTKPRSRPALPPVPPPMPTAT